MTVESNGQRSLGDLMTSIATNSEAEYRAANAVTEGDSAMTAIGTDQRPMICWAINNHGFQCHAKSTHLVARGEITVDSCAQHLAKVISHVGQASGQSWLAPMTVTVVTIPKGDS